MTRVYVHACGAVTGLGLDALHCVASLRAGLDAYFVAPFWGEAEQDLQLAAIRGYADGLLGVERYEALALRALVPALDGLSQHERSSALVFVGLPLPTRPGVPARLARQLLPRLAERLELAPANFGAIEAGRASTILGLEQALAACAQGRACVIGGVDCLVNPSSLAGLSREGMLKEEWDGFIPGEGAAFVRVGRQPGPGMFGGSAVRVAGVGVADEPADGSTAQPLVGVGVRRAFERAAASAGVNEAQIELCVNDVNGARAAFEDEAFGWIRFFRSARPRGYLEVWHVASFAGELGAAAGAMGLIWAAAALELGFHPARHVLLSTSEAKRRTALVLAAVPRSARPWLEVSVVRAQAHAAEPKRLAAYDEPRGIRIAGADELHRRLLQRHLEALGALASVIRAHHRAGSAPWEDLEGFEARVLAHYDALGWDGTEARALALSQLGSEEPDESAAAALALLASELDEVSIQRIVEVARGDAAHCEWICELLRFAPVANAEVLLRRMLEHANTCSAALDTLRQLRLLRASHVQGTRRASSSDIDAALVRALGWLAEPAGWEAARPKLARLAHVSDETLLAVLLIAPSARDVFEAAGLRSFGERPLVCQLAKHKHRDAGELPWSSPEALVTEAGLLALGFCGDARARPILLDALRSPDPALALKAAEALQLIYDVSPMSKVEVRDPDAPDDPPQIKEQLSVDPTIWSAVQPTTHRPLRLGQPLVDAGPLRTLRHSRYGTAIRHWATWEYALATRSQPLSATQCVIAQRALLSAP